VIDAAFWASLRRQEGYIPRLLLAILDPEQARQPLWFAKGFPLTPDSMAKVSPCWGAPMSAHRGNRGSLSWMN
jgi:hypothetical protein